MRWRLSCVLIALSVLLACGNKNEPATSSSDSTGVQTDASNQAPKPGLLEQMSKPEVVPAGKAITVRLNQTVGSKASNPGESFTATVAEPVMGEDGKVLIPKGSTASGTVEDAQPLGHFKGGALLRISLNSVEIEGKKYKIETAAVTHTLKGKGKRTAEMVGGGAGLGALVGGLAGGGKGALIGVAAGAGAGTAGAGLTGNKEIVLPAESAVSFKLAQPLELK